MAVGEGADVIVVDRSLHAAAPARRRVRQGLKTEYSTRDAVEALVRQADVVIGSVLIRGEAAPRLVSRAMVAGMRPGSVLVDIAIDQGGCFETSRLTTHDAPTYVEERVVHYCVTNMPGAVPSTSTYALTNVTLPYALKIAVDGLEDAVGDDDALALGVNVIAGEVTNPGVAEAHGMTLTPLSAIVDGLS